MEPKLTLQGESGRRQSKLDSAVKLMKLIGDALKSQKNNQLTKEEVYQL